MNMIEEVMRIAEATGGQSLWWLHINQGVWLEEAFVYQILESYGEEDDAPEGESFRA